MGLIRFDLQRLTLGCPCALCPTPCAPCPPWAWPPPCAALRQGHWERALEPSSSVRYLEGDRSHRHEEEEEEEEEAEDIQRRVSRVFGLGNLPALCGFLVAKAAAVVLAGCSA